MTKNNFCYAINQLQRNAISRTSLTIQQLETQWLERYTICWIFHKYEEKHWYRQNLTSHHQLYFLCLLSFHQVPNACFFVTDTPIYTIMLFLRRRFTFVSFWPLLHHLTWILQRINKIQNSRNGEQECVNEEEILHCEFKSCQQNCGQTLLQGLAMALSSFQKLSNVPSNVLDQQQQLQKSIKTVLRRQYESNFNTNKWHQGKT